MRPKIVGAVGVFALAACTSETVAPTSQDGISLALTVTTPDLRLGQHDTITVTITNTNSHAVTLNFANGCQILPYVRDAHGVNVLPGDGGWACTAQVSQLVLAGGERHSETFVWSGSTEFVSELLLRPLPPGQYFVSATLTAVEMSLTAQPASVRLD